MTIWIVLGAITLLLAGFILWPIFSSNRKAASDEASDASSASELEDGSPENELSRDLAVYRDQLSEIDRDIERGVLSAEQADAARTEVQRRILAADQRIKKQQPTDTIEQTSANKPVRAIAAGFIVLFIAGGFGLYLDLGNPTMPDRPITSRADEINAVRMAQTADEDRQSVLNRAVSDLSQRLLENPDDLRAWELLGASLMALGRPEEAQTAFLETVKRSGRDGDYLAMYAESLIRSNNGQINTTARGVLREAEKTDSTDPRIQFYLGLADAQEGNVGAAVDRWIALANGAPGDAPWLPMVVGRINEAALAQGIDIEGRLNLAENTSPGPSQEDIAAAQEMTPEEQQQMIMSMVNGLAERLEAEPNNPDGWARLMQAYMVLGREDDAKAAFEKASTVFADQPEMIARFDSLAQEIGISAN
ncbi:MAG: c-type cytochrome biogenesis protein CcmI [Thalassospira sp.]|uniref:c-type cytochrome biogenesis protein CcmI n=1 Tax=Thalassospira sp. TaxID=1912094 RepID=UPI001B251A8A|nr:c-type cytochrome biogenesis protein CcmI [Thalassospira sp.]MBO6577749.1 c-type cytochrome biogenesis protein CcmI [Thalassospira sp.]MBO6802146.1 c-type cytochrome biogenesis protein CcmI [Thalassospira sp.]MBO6818593.1 c-type cytochrome biogenesis protein CcmI [Thalassospira sp.]MBO6887457.1 c-type cytochrome biogenesis protein CcmI [Thalassospira sp.]